MSNRPRGQRSRLIVGKACRKGAGGFRRREVAKVAAVRANAADQALFDG
jgi:hypothetical protein